MMSWNMARQQNQRNSHLRGFYTAATKIMLDHWSRVNWSPSVTKTPAIPKTTKLQRWFKFAIIDNARVLSFGQAQPFQPAAIFFLLADTKHIQHNFTLHCRSCAYCHYKISRPERRSVFLFHPKRHYSSPLLLPTEAWKPLV